MKENVLAMLYHKNKEDNELKLIINFSLKLFDFSPQFFFCVYFCIYFQGAKDIRGVNEEQEGLWLTEALLPLAGSVAQKE